MPEFTMPSRTRRPGKRRPPSQIPIGIPKPRASTRDVAHSASVRPVMASRERLSSGSMVSGTGKLGGKRTKEGATELSTPEFAHGFPGDLALEEGGEGAGLLGAYPGKAQGIDE
jgi:hypothetical protein